MVLFQSGLRRQQPAIGDQALKAVAIVVFIATILIADCLLLQLINGELQLFDVIGWMLTSLLPCIGVAAMTYRFHSDRFALITITISGLLVMLALDLVLFPPSADFVSDLLDRTRAKLPLAISFAFAGVFARLPSTRKRNSPKQNDDNGVLEELLRAHALRAAGNYVEVRGPATTCLVRLTIAGAVERLSAHGYVRIHRSWIVKAAAVVDEVRDRHGLKALRLESGDLIPVGRTYRRETYKLIAARHSSHTS
ncbi:MAG: LytTR family DNA-binding domain-containing protein [Pseudomonadota bacterium]